VVFAVLGHVVVVVEQRHVAPERERARLHEEPRAADGPVDLGRRRQRVAERHVDAALGVPARHVEEQHPATHRRRDARRLCVLQVQRERQERRAIRGLLQVDDQFPLAARVVDPVRGGLIAARAREQQQVPAQGLRVEGPGRVMLEPTGNLGRASRRHALRPDERRHDRRRRPAGPAGGGPGLVRRRADGVGPEILPMRLGLCIPPLDEFLEPAEAGAADALEIRHEDEVGGLERPPRAGAHHHGQRFVEDPEDRVVPLLRCGFHPDVDGNHAVGKARLFHDVGGHVVEDPAVDEDPAAVGHRREHARDGDRRAQRPGKPTRIEDHDFGVADVGGDAAERRWQGVEIDLAPVRRGDPVEEQLRLLRGTQPRGQPEAAAKAEAQRRRERPGVFFPAKRLEHERRIGRQDARPVDTADQFPDLSRRHARREAAPDEPAHAGAADHVHRHAVFVEPQQDADVGEAARPASAKRQSDARSRRLARQRRLRGRLGQARGLS